MRYTLALAFVVSCLLLASLSQANPQGATPTYFVDPAIGIDAPGQGGPDAPYRTVTYALANHPGPVELRLAAGTYSAPNETFPLVLGGGDVLRGPATGGARLVGGAGGPYLVVVTASQGAGIARLEHLVLDGNAGAPLVDLAHTSQSATALSLELRDCQLRTLVQAIRVRNSAGVAPLSLTLERVDVRATFLALGADYQGGTQGSLQLVDSRLHGGGGAVSVRARGGEAGPAILVANARRTVFERSNPAIASRSDGAGKVVWVVDRCVFAGSGWTVCPVPLGPGAGAIVDSGPTLAGNITYQIGRSIFWANWPGCAGPVLSTLNLVDLGSYRPGDYQVDRCVLQQVPPVGGWSGTNRNGDPRWFRYEAVALGTNDYHLLPDSPAIDWALGYPLDLDFEGDPSAPPCGDGISDAGVDEFRPRDQWIAPKLVVGANSTLALVGPPGGFASVWAGALLGVDPCAGDLAIAPLFPLASAVPLSPSGAAERPLPVPLLPVLVGYEFAFQSLFVTPEATWGGLSAPRSATVGL